MNRPSLKQKYKIKLITGRIVGPIDIERVRLFIIENQIVGQELAREHPQGEWVDINLIRPIGQLLVAKAEGRLDFNGPGAMDAIEPGALTSSLKIERFGEAGETTRMLPEPDRPEKTLMSKIEIESVEGSDKPRPGAAPKRAAFDEPPQKERSVGTEEDPDATQLMLRDLNKSTKPPAAPIGGPDESLLLDYTAINRGSGQTETARGSIAAEQTIMLENPLSFQHWTLADVLRDPRRLPRYLKIKFGDLNTQIRNGAVTAAVAYIIWQILSSADPPAPMGDVLWTPYRPALPAYTGEKSDVAKSAKLYADGVRYYLQDTVPGYKLAADRFSRAIIYDNQNVKAEAMLASSYINLIDSSNKDDNYFTVISKLIDLSRAKDIDLPETVIADVEFYIVTNKPEAAQSRIVEYTRSRPNFAQEMFYYLAFAFFQRGDLSNANRFINQYQAKPFSAKVNYLRGQIAEKMGDADLAIREYEQAISLNPRHAKSRLAIARILASTHRIQNASTQIEFLTSGRYEAPKGMPILERVNSDGTLDNRKLLAPLDLAQAYSYASMLSQLHGKIDLALAQMERSIRLDPDNPELLLQYYSLRAKHGEKLSKIQPEARMFFFLSEGEKFIRQGDYHAALSQFLMARQQMPKSTVPLVKIGDMFFRIHDLTNARENYKQAAEKAPRNIEIWTKYINTLIQSYEWEEAKTAMDRFRELPVPQSAIDKAAADMYAKQGRQADAQVFYRKAMQRDMIDSSVYIAYAKSLIATKNYKEAPFFFALALRFDPLNVDAIVGTAKCIAATESIDRAISFLQDQLQKGSAPIAELSAAIAEFEIQKGAWDSAEQFVNRAMQADADYAYSYYLQAQIYLNREGADKTALDKALEAFNSYSDRNQSDPSGYLERYRIFIKKGNYEKASDELAKIFAIYPKYPNLHFFKGVLYSVMGNHRSAIEEFGIELKYNPMSVSTLIAMGKEYIEMGGGQEGLTLFQKAMQLEPRSAEAKAEAANANFLLKNYQGAIALYLGAIALDKGNPLYYKRIGWVYRTLGDNASATAAFNKYLEMEPDAPDKAEIDRYR